MKKIIYVLVVLLFLLALWNIFPLDFATSIVPGWHATIYPPYLIASITMFLIFLIDTLLYWRAVYIRSILAKRIIIIHFIISCLFSLLISNFSRLFPTDTEADLIAFADKLIYLAQAFRILQIAYLIVISILLFKRKQQVI